jgi:CheY-like chemotaxis protein
VRLPVAAIEPADAERKDEELSPRAVPVRAQRLLVVDDNRDMVKSFAQLLKLEGHEVFQAYDGPGALSVARVHPPDVIFLDIGLPGKDGYEVARELSALPELAGTVLVAVSGYGQERDSARAREAGFQHHLVKPVDFAALESLLGQ